MSQYDVLVPTSLDEALAWKQQHGAALIPFAGGTDLMVLLEAGKLIPGRFLNLSKLKDLSGIEVRSHDVKIGALTTFSEIARHPGLGQEFPNLVRAATLTGAVAIQNRGTLGGNISNASPAADSPPALLAYDALIELVSARGSRQVPYSSFHTGYKTTLRTPDELIAGVILPRKECVFHDYRKVGTRRAQAISKVVMAATATFEGKTCSHVRIAFGSVGPTTMRVPGAEALLLGKSWDLAVIAQAVDSLNQEIRPIDDIRSNAHYRLNVAGNILRSCLTAWAQAVQ